jgi:hypothetical protein
LAAVPPRGQPPRAHRVVLIERNPGVFNTLLINLTRELPLLGYRDEGPMVWRHARTGSRVEAVFDDARKVLPEIEPAPGEWLFINNDPNNMSAYALDTPVLEGWMRGAERYGAFMSTLGCNVNGLKRLSPEEREGWFDHLDDAQRIIRAHTRLDLLLFEVCNDASQWAYLILVPKDWAQKTMLKMSKLCSQTGIKVNAVSAASDFAAFRTVCERLFRTTKERQS